MAVNKVCTQKKKNSESPEDERRSQKGVDKVGTLNFLLKHTGGLIAFERVGRVSASPNASVN